MVSSQERTGLGFLENGENWESKEGFSSGHTGRKGQSGAGWLPTMCSRVQLQQGTSGSREEGLWKAHRSL